ncbi:MAG: energy transducer TonB [Anaerolineae bacterium]|nr:energy transducer TonB [Gemmatimonadaceae bacterium]
MSFAAHASILVAVVAVAPPAAVPSDSRVISSAYYLFPEVRAMRPPPKEEKIRWLNPESAPKLGALELREIDDLEEVKTIFKEPAGFDRTVLSEEAPATDLPDSDTLYSEIEVDSVVARSADSGAPVYPSVLLAQRIEGSAQVQFVVDTIGFAEPTSFKVLSATQPEFAEAVRGALPVMRFRPALFHSRKVRQLVQQSFTFKIVPPDPSGSDTTSTPH